MAFALDNRLCSKDGGGTADGASRGCHEGGVAVELKHAAEPQAEEDGARNDDSVDNDGRHADGCHLGKRKAETVKHDACTQKLLGTELDAGHPCLGQFVAKTVGIEHAENDSDNERT